MPEARRYSLRGRLLWMLLGAFALAWTGTAIVSYFDARHEISELFDAQLASAAALMLAQVRHDADELELPELPESHKYQRRLLFQVFDEHDRMVLRSAGAPHAPLAQSLHGFDHQDYDGARWRLYGVADREHDVRVVVAERADVRSELATHIAAGVLKPLVYAVPLVALLVWLGVTRGLSPLARLARAVEQRAPGTLAPVDAPDAPLEVAPLVGALNRLLARVGVALEKERRFTDDAAHELRTPLAAIRTQAQVALAARDDGERARALAQVVRGADRAARLAEQLLVLARLDPEGAERPSARVDLRQIAAEAVGQLAPAALAKSIDIAVEDDGPAEVSGDPALLAALARNLVDNAVRYTPAGGRVQVRAPVEDGGAVFEVADSGPGIPAAERERVQERFYRVLGTGEEGSGLGLSIVRRIADLHGARLVLEDGAGGAGLRVRVVFPALR
jgi:two-component system sensor histidine kinase QseC